MILTFRHLEKHELGEQIFETAKAYLSARRMTMGQGTIVDATLIAAPISTFTRAKPECAGGERTRRGSGIQRRTNVVGIVPNDAAITRLVGSQLLEQQEEWHLERGRLFSDATMARIPAPEVPLELIAGQHAEKEEATIS